MRKGNEFDPLLPLLSTLKKKKSNSRWIMGLKVKVKTVKLVKENIG